MIAYQIKMINSNIKNKLHYNQVKNLLYEL